MKLEKESNVLLKQENNLGTNVLKTRILGYVFFCCIRFVNENLLVDLMRLLLLSIKYDPLHFPSPLTVLFFLHPTSKAVVLMQV